MEEEFGRGRVREEESCWKGLQLNMFVKKKAMLFGGRMLGEVGGEGGSEGSDTERWGQDWVVLCQFLQSQKVLRTINYQIILTLICVLRLARGEVLRVFTLLSFSL